MSGEGKMSKRIDASIVMTDCQWTCEKNLSFGSHSCFA